TTRVGVVGCAAATALLWGELAGELWAVAATAIKLSGTAKAPIINRALADRFTRMKTSALEHQWDKPVVLGSNPLRRAGAKRCALRNEVAHTATLARARQAGQEREGADDSVCGAGDLRVTASR